MEVFVVLKVYEASFPNDYKDNEAYEDMSCEGVFKTFDEAVASTRLPVQSFYASLLNDRKLSLSEGWRAATFGMTYFILKKSLL